MSDDSGSTACEKSEDELTAYDECEDNPTLRNKNDEMEDKWTFNNGTSAKKPSNSCVSWVIQSIRKAVINSPFMTIWRQKDKPWEMVKRVKKEKKLKN